MAVGIQLVSAAFTNFLMNPNPSWWEPTKLFPRFGQFCVILGIGALGPPRIVNDSSLRSEIVTSPGTRKPWSSLPNPRRSQRLSNRNQRQHQKVKKALRNQTPQINHPRIQRNWASNWGQLHSKRPPDILRQICLAQEHSQTLNGHTTGAREYLVEFVRNNERH